MNIAYAMHGAGPPIVFVRGLNSHVERMWHEPWKRAYFGALARAFQVTVFDARGNGLSDVTEDIELEGLVEDVRAVVEDAGLEQVTLYGQGWGSPIAIAYAAEHPDRIERLLLYCSYANGADLGLTDDYIETFRRSPGAGIAEMMFATYPEIEALPARLLRDTFMSTKAEVTARYLEVIRGVDVRDLLPRIKVPTLVLHPERSPGMPQRLGRDVAAGIEGAEFMLIPGGSYNPWAETESEPTLIAIGDFTGRTVPLSPEPRAMAVLVTDLVGSTEMTHRLGEERARDLFHDHDAIVREARKRHGGREVKHTGDGIMVRFDDPADAVSCSVAIQELFLDRNESLSDDQLHVRVGVVFGDVLEERDGIFGTTVALAVRVMDQADAGEVLVSESVRKVLESEHRFGPQRVLELKGFPQPVAVYELLWAK